MGHAARVKNKATGKVYSISTVAQQKTYPTNYGPLPGDFETAVYEGNPGALKRPLAFVVYAAGNNDELDEDDFHKHIAHTVMNMGGDSLNELIAALESQNYEVMRENWRQANFGLKRVPYLFLFMR